jgi:hypothetical protein
MTLSQPQIDAIFARFLPFRMKNAAACAFAESSDRGNRFRLRAAYLRPDGWLA